MFEAFELAVIWIIGLVIAGLIGLGAWAIFQEATEIESGTVVDKMHTEEVTSLVPIYSYCGKGCSTMTIVPVTQPECWALYLRDGDSTGDVCVSKYDWDQVLVGEHWGTR